jgi:hypothetical protein
MSPEIHTAANACRSEAASGFTLFTSDVARAADRDVPSVSAQRPLGDAAASMMMLWTTKALPKSPLTK